MMQKWKKRMLSLALAACVMGTVSIPAFAAEADTNAAEATEAPQETIEIIRTAPDLEAISQETTRIATGVESGLEYMSWQYLGSVTANTGVAENGNLAPLGSVVIWTDNDVYMTVALQRLEGSTWKTLHVDAKLFDGKIGSHTYQFQVKGAAKNYYYRTYVVVDVWEGYGVVVERGDVYSGSRYYV